MPRSVLLGKANDSRIPRPSALILRLVTLVNRLTASTFWTKLKLRDGERTPNRLGTQDGEAAPRSYGGESVVNGFHLHAIGWVLTANTFSLTPAEAHELAELWTNLVRIRAEHLRQTYPLLQFLFPRSLPLSPATRAALATLAQRMAALHPERFGAEALRQRRNHWARQVVLGFLLSALSVILVPTNWPWAATVPPTFFLMGCACVLPTVTLWRAAAVVHEFATQGRIAWHWGQRPSHRF